MADKITNANLIKTTQIQQKQTDNSMIALRPETQADIVINTSTNILGATVDEAFDNALPVVGAGAVEVNLKNNQLERQSFLTALKFMNNVVNILPTISSKHIIFICII